jgi:AbrB family looped-hinge helix DNA binding protein
MPYRLPYRRTVTLTSKGQITVPVELRRLWQLAKGDRLEFTFVDDDRVMVRKFIRLSSEQVLSAATLVPEPGLP